MIPRPINEKPWAQPPRVPTVFDKNNLPVSFVVNAEHVLAVCQVHEQLVEQLGRMVNAYETGARSVGVAPEIIAMAVAPARELLKFCEPPPAEMTADTQVTR